MNLLIPLFIHSFNAYLLSVYHVPGTVLFPDMHSLYGVGRHRKQTNSSMLKE